METEFIVYVRAAGRLSQVRIGLEPTGEMLPPGRFVLDRSRAWLRFPRPYDDLELRDGETLGGVKARRLVDALITSEESGGRLGDCRLRVT